MGDQSIWRGARVLAVVAALAGASGADAAILSVPGSYTTYTDPNEADFLAAAPGLTLENFDSAIATSTVQSCNGPFNAATNDACFMTGDIVPGIEAYLIDQGGGGLMLNAPVGSLNANAIDVVGPNSTADDLGLAFSGSPNAIGVDVLSLGNSGTVSITVTGLGGTIAVTNVSVGAGAPSFFGIIAYEPIVGLDFSGSGIAEGVGNVRFGTVFLGLEIPEPEGFWLFSLGALCVFGLRRRVFEFAIAPPRR